MAKRRTKKKSVDVFKKNNALQIWRAIAIVAVLLLIISVFTNGFKGKISDVEVKDINTVASKTLDFINNNLLQPGSSAELVGTSEYKGLYELKMKIGDRELSSYVTKDGELFFTQGIDLSEVPETPQREAQETTPTVAKSDKPEIELFVMSHCPYGTQMEKGILPVVGTLGDKIDFNVRFVSYAMHGEKEVLEQLNQYCIQKEQNDKYISYLTCFLETGDGTSCLAEAGIDQNALSACTEALDAEFEITKNLNDKSTWLNGRFPLFEPDKELNTRYGVRGSPTLVINGETVSVSRDSATLLKTVCGAFNEVPEECNAELPATAPSPGFGFTESESASISATCG